MILVSACLAGVRCRYDGADNAHGDVVSLVARGEAVAVCPEVLGGLPTPRVPSERLGTRVIDAHGRDVTAEFRKGAEAALAICRSHGCGTAILKSRSPSCGCGRIYDGSFTRTLGPGNGVFCDLLLEEGISVRTEEEL